MVTWEDVIKNEQVEIDSELMHLPKYEKLKMMAMHRLLERHYSAPELEGELIEMMEKIANR
tara:strand:+ start:363 stop:545 length:183 start_codon:yes stop_codon:yes gene_type:complete